MPTVYFPEPICKISLDITLDKLHGINYILGMPIITVSYVLGVVRNLKEAQTSIILSPRRILFVRNYQFGSKPEGTISFPHKYGRYGFLANWKLRS